MNPTPAQALAVLYESAQKAAMPAQLHIMCQQAFDLLTAAIQPKLESKDDAVS